MKLGCAPAPIVVRGWWNSSKAWPYGLTAVGDRSLGESVEPAGGWREVEVAVNGVPASRGEGNVQAAVEWSGGDGFS